MKLQKSRRIRRKQAKRQQTKRKQKHTMRKQSKRRRYSKRRTSYKNKKYYGGNFNSEEKIVLIGKLKKIGFNEDELPAIIEELDLGSQQFSGNNLKQLTDQIDGMNKEQFKEWLENTYSFFVEDVETDYESD
jgi:hypothetical protein